MSKLRLGLKPKIKGLGLEKILEGLGLISDSKSSLGLGSQCLIYIPATHTVNVCAKFHLNPFTKYRDITPCKMGVSR